jgi:hypothetical protein
VLIRPRRGTSLVGLLGIGSKLAMGKRVTLVVCLLAMVVIGLWSLQGRPGRGAWTERADAGEARDPGRGEELVPARKTEATDLPQPTIRSARATREAQAREEEELAALVGTLALEPGLLLAPDETFADAELCWSDGDVQAYGFPEADGAFVLEGLPVGVALTLEVRAAFGEARAELAPLRPGERRRLELALGRGAFDGVPWRRVLGTVLDEQGQPVVGARIGARVATEGSEDLELAPRMPQSDESGSFSVGHLPADLCRIYVWHHEVAIGDATELDLRTQDRDGIVLRVERGVELEGEVVWPDGTFVKEFWGTCGERSVRGDGGLLLVPGFLPESTVLRLEARRPGSLGKLEETVIPGAVPRRHILQETALVPVRCVVVDSSGSSLEATVKAQFFHAGPWSDTGQVEQTPDGAYLVWIPPGDAHLQVDSERYHAQALDVSISGPTELRFVLEPAGMIRGHVLDPSGRPMAGARVINGSAFAFQYATTDASGAFWFYSESSPARVSAGASGFARTGTLELDPHDERSASSVVLRLRESCLLEGRVSGRAPESVEVAIELIDDILYAEVEPDGSFHRAEIPPGTGQVFVNTWDGSEELSGPRVTVEFTPGTPARVELSAP